MKYSIALKFLLVAYCSKAAIAQVAGTCSVPEIGVCLGNLCPPGFTCLSSGCCADANVVTTTTAAVTTVTISASNCVDRLNPATGVSDCRSVAFLCNNALYSALMTQQCPATCGRCTAPGPTTNSTSCVDLTNPSTGASDCPSRAYLCNNSIYFTLMTQQCPLTCGRCTTTNGGAISTNNCVDLTNPSTGVSDCPSRANLCNNSIYFTLMTQQCPATCGRCSGKK